MNYKMKRFLSIQLKNITFKNLRNRNHTKMIKFLIFAMLIQLFFSKCETAACVATTLQVIQANPIIENIDVNDPNVIEAAKFALRDHFELENNSFEISQATMSRGLDDEIKYQIYIWCTGCFYGFQQCSYDISVKASVNVTEVTQFACVL